jgi:hypothetical protein
MWREFAIDIIYSTVCSFQLILRPVGLFFDGAAVPISDRFYDLLIRKGVLVDISAVYVFFLLVLNLYRSRTQKYYELCGSTIGEETRMSADILYRFLR